MYETDGLHIARSVNGGCDFDNVYVAPELPAPVGGQIASTTGIASVASIRKLAMSPVGGGRAMAILETSLQNATGVEHQTLVVTNVEGNSWNLGQNGLPFVGRALDIDVANDKVAYILTSPRVSDLPVGSVAPNGGAIYVTQDGGRTWSPGSTALPFTKIRVDPAQPTTVYGFGTSGLFVSADSGLTFSSVDAVSGSVTDVVVQPVGGGLRLLKASLAKGGLMLAGATGPASGQTAWTTIKTPTISELDHTSVGSDPRDSALFTDYISSGQFFIVLHLFGKTRFFNLTPFGSGPLSRLQSAQGWVTATDHSQIWRARSESNGSGGHFTVGIRVPPQIELPPVKLGPTVVRKALPPQLLPANQTVTMRPGETGSAQLHLRLPATPTPLDVMFLIDTTSSMTPTISGLRAGIGDIAAKLAATGIDVNFGLGDFQDYPIAPFGCGGQATSTPFSGPRCTKPDHPYERLLPISPPGRPLAAALERVTLGDGGDGPEATLPAVYQAATGAGQAKIPGLPAGGYYIQPGLAAGFRPGAVKVMVVATDIGFHAPKPGRAGTPCLPAEPTPGCDTESGYPGPTWAAVKTALNQRGIRVVGLDVSGFDNSDAFRDESRLAKDSGTLAPAGGVDCDADGHIDLKAGKPLVCAISATGEDTSLDLAPSIVSLLKALRDVTPVSFAVTSRDHRPGIAILKPAVIPHVDVKADNDLGLKVMLSCPSGADTTHPLSITSTIRGRQVASAGLTLECRAPIRQPPPVIPIVPIIAPALVIPVAPPAPPAQLPQSNPNPNPQANVQPGAAAEEQQDPQLAIAGADPVAGPDDEVVFEKNTQEMSAVHAVSTTGPPPGFSYFLVALATVCAAGGAVAVTRQRRAVQHAFAWVDRQ